MWVPGVDTCAVHVCLCVCTSCMHTANICMSKFVLVCLVCNILCGFCIRFAFNSYGMWYYVHVGVCRYARVCGDYTRSWVYFCSLFNSTKAYSQYPYSSELNFHEGCLESFPCAVCTHTHHTECNMKALSALQICMHIHYTTTYYESFKFTAYTSIDTALNWNTKTHTSVTNTLTPT